MTAEQYEEEKQTEKVSVKEPLDEIQRRYYKFAMAGVIFSGLVLLLAVGTFYCQQQFNASILSPDIDVKLVRKPELNSPLSNFFEPINVNARRYVVSYDVTNTGEKTIYGLKWGGEADTILRKQFNPSETHLVPEWLALAPGTTDTLQNLVTIPQKAFKSGGFYVHVWLKCTSAANKEYIYHKVFEFDISKVIELNNDSTQYRFKEGEVSWRTMRSERIP